MGWVRRTGGEERCNGAETVLKCGWENELGFVCFQADM